MATLDLYYDIVCPYAYIASTLAEAVARESGAELVWRPVLLGGLLKVHGAPQVPYSAMSPAKVRYGLRDVERWAEHYGVELRFPAGHPSRTVDAMRLLLLASPADRAPLTHALYRAYWVEGRRVDDLSVLLDVANAADLDGADLVERIRDPDVKLALRQATDEAASRGIFGVPTFVVGGHLFWGQDRLHFVKRVLAGEAVPGLDDLSHFNL